MSNSGESEALQPDELRKREEIEFHNRLRASELQADPTAYQYLTSNYKYYAVDRTSRQYLDNWLSRRKGGRLLDYCCGEGEYSLLAARHGVETVGIDISDVSIDICRKRLQDAGLAERTSFQVMDAEKLAFPDRSFNSILCAGVLHHLDLDRAYQELSRVVTQDGEVMCLEALAHNPAIQLYRRLTPHLRTAYEAKHILRMQDVRLARKYFRDVEVRFFHLATLAAVPFRNSRHFDRLLSLLERVDAALLKVPGLQTQAWMVMFVLRGPRS